MPSILSRLPCILKSLEIFPPVSQIPWGFTQPPREGSLEKCKGVGKKKKQQKMMLAKMPENSSCKPKLKKKILAKGDQGRSNHIHTYAHAYLKNPKSINLFVYRFISEKATFTIYACKSFSVVVLLLFCIRKTLWILPYMGFETFIPSHHNDRNKIKGKKIK